MTPEEMKQMLDVMNGIRERTRNLQPAECAYVSNGHGYRGFTCVHPDEKSVFPALSGGVYHRRVDDDGQGKLEIYWDGDDPNSKPITLQTLSRDVTDEDADRICYAWVLGLHDIDRIHGFSETGPVENSDGESDSDGV